MANTKQEKEAKKLKRYKAQLDKPEAKFYLWGLMALIVAVHMLDTYISDIGSKVQSLYMDELLIRGQNLSQSEALSVMGIIQLIGVVFIVISPFYKALIDRVGRRPIFITNIFGMATGTLICYFAHNIYLFVLGLFFIVFFVIHDLQILYVMEVAPKNARSTMYGITKFVGVFGILAIPALRSIFITETSAEWRPLYLIPAMASFAVGLIAILFLRESKVFLKSRIETLSIPLDERKKNKKGGEAKQSGIKNAFMFIFSNNQLKWLSVAMITLMCASVAVISYFEPFMKFAGMSDGQITSVLYIQPFIMAVLYLICGFSADIIGRKKTMVLFSFICLASAIAFVITVWQGLSPWVIGVIFGLVISSYWNVADVMGIMYVESVPTKLRGSVMGVQAYVMLVGQVIGLLIYNILILFMDLGLIRIILATPFLLLAPIIIILKIKETKGVDLETVGKEDNAEEAVEANN